MTASFTIVLDDQEVTAYPGETLWQVAKRAGESIPHLCFKDAPGYRADGNCRACMVEVEGERVLAASCIREAKPGMVVHSAHSPRATQARETVLELLMADQPSRAQSPDRSSHFWEVADQLAVDEAAVKSWLPPRRKAAVNHAAAAPKVSQPDTSHPAMHVNLDACITCNLCVRACREVQSNDVIGMAQRGAAATVVFDFADSMGQSTCVGCGECVQACPTGALMPATVVNAAGQGDSQSQRQVDSVCPYCGVGCQLTYHINDDALAYVEGRNGPANQNRLCVKGRFGFDYVSHPTRLTKPLIRLPGIPKALDSTFDPANPFSHFHEASWDEALEIAAGGLMAIKQAQGPKALAGFGSAKCSNEEAWLFQKLVRTG
ncbi:MAG: 2Fe-2S iron-sulfur cluster-binding protein, partial [Pseudomonadota bacterium]|nr:2Fe-2S iron-sulfur cluster-binding protein [Pseudomonadota bacterium]